MSGKTPSEFSEQVAVVNHLRRCGVFVFAIPNGGDRPPEAAVKASEEGAEAGASDLVIPDSPPKFPGWKGVALEMKRADGTSKSVNKPQILFLRKMMLRGFVPVVGFGFRDTIAKLRSLGYPV